MNKKYLQKFYKLTKLTIDQIEESDTIIANFGDDVKYLFCTDLYQQLKNIDYEFEGEIAITNAPASNLPKAQIKALINAEIVKPNFQVYKMEEVESKFFDESKIKKLLELNYEKSSKMIKEKWNQENIDKVKKDFEKKFREEEENLISENKKQMELFVKQQEQATEKYNDFLNNQKSYIKKFKLGGK